MACAITNLAVAALNYGDHREAARHFAELERLGATSNAILDIDALSAEVAWLEGDVERARRYLLPALERRRTTLLSAAHDEVVLAAQIAAGSGRLTEAAALMAAAMARQAEHGFQFPADWLRADTELAPARGDAGSRAARRRLGARPPALARRNHRAGDRAPGRRVSRALPAVCDGLEVGEHLVRQVREGGRNLHAGPELILGLVDQEAAIGGRERVLEERAARRAVVAGEEVAAVLLLGHIRVADPSIQPLISIWLASSTTFQAQWWGVPSAKCHVPGRTSGSWRSSIRLP